MKVTGVCSPITLVSLLCLATCAAADRRAEVTPVQKVISLMEGMLEKGKADKHAESVQFATYKQFCEDTAGEKKSAIAKAEKEMEFLASEIESNAAKAEKLTKEIAKLDKDISVWENDMDAATKVRAIEKAAADALIKDYSESIDASEMAIKVLKKQAYDRKQADSFTQVRHLQGLKLVPEETKNALEQFMSFAQQGEDLGSSAPEANAYEFQSSAVITMLEKLLDKFIEERTAAEQTEANSKRAYQLLMQELTNEVNSAKADRSAKAKAKAGHLQAKATAEGDLSDTTTTKAADTKYLQDLTATCEQKAGAFEKRQNLRIEELEAIQTAIDIIAGGAVAGAAETYLPSMLQQPSAVQPVLAQLRAGSLAATYNQQRTIEFLKQKSKQLNSRVLSALASHLGANPLAKVIRMIKDLIVKLIEEANGEAEHKGWCDTELSTNEQTRAEKTQAVEQLHAEIDQLEASLAKLGEDIAALSDDLSELDKAMAEATKIRASEKEKNTKTVQDAKEAQTAVAQALTVLREFYAKAADSTAFIQQQPEAPEIFDEPYKGMQSGNGGVIGMLEVIMSDFARLEADTESSEASSQEEYETFMTDSKVDKAAKSTDLDNAQVKETNEKKALVLKKKDLLGTDRELTAALAYYDKLKPSCIDAGVSYEDRVARRKEEIESLREALKILNGEDLR